MSLWKEFKRNLLWSEKLRNIIKDSISNQKRKTVTVLSSLLAVQDSLHYIPDEAVEEISIQEQKEVVK